jgi:hypothetical protein
MRKNGHIAGIINIIILVICGGDCTNFISQCLYAGSGIMNYSKNNGWYYNSGNDKSPSWSGVQFLYNFLINNRSVGPYGEKVEVQNTQIGDIAQLNFNGGSFTHTLLIINKLDEMDLSKILIATHSYDSINRAISTYDYQQIRFIHINGVRNW